MTWSLAVFCEALEGLVDERHVALIDVDAQQSQAPRGTAADTVEELQRLTHHVVVGATVLMSQVVLQDRQTML